MNQMENSQAPNQQQYSKLQKNPATVVPFRVFLMSLGVTAIIVGVAYFFGFDLIRLVAGFWIGVVANLVNFRLICLGARNTANKAEAGGKVTYVGGYVGRQVISGAALLAGAFLGLPAMILSLIGLSMAKFAIQLDGFFNYKF